MALIDELDTTIQDVHETTRNLEIQLEDLRREIAHNQHILTDALRLYRSTTGSPHALDDDRNVGHRERPRAERVLAVMDAAGGPITLSELVAAMPDQPVKGAISAVIHRAIDKGEVRRLKRGVYELTGRSAEAS